MELIEEITLDKIHYNYFVSKPYVIKPATYFIFSDYNIPTLIPELEQLNIPFSKFKKIHVPITVKNIKGVTVNTNKIYPDLTKIISNLKIPLRLIKILPKKNDNLYLIVDMNPLLNQLTRVFKRLKYNKFDLYFNMINLYASKYQNYSEEFYPILYFTSTNEEFIDELTKYLLRKKFKIESQLEKLFVVVKTDKGPLYTILGTGDGKELSINKNIYYRILRIYEDTKQEDIKKATKDIEKENIEVKVEHILKKYDIKKPQIKTNLKTILIQHIATEPELLKKVKTDEDIHNLVQNAIHSVTGIDIDLTKLSKKEAKTKLEEIGSVFTKYQRVVPKVNLELAKVVPIEETTQIDSTIVDRRDKEFNEQQHYYIKEIFKKFEQGSKPIKIKKIKKELKDNNINRFYKYTITVEDKNKNKYDLHVNMPALINGKYFKLNGKNYILTNQLFLKPITKTKQNSVRFLSNYATITLELRNIKVPITDLNEVLDYIVNKYSDKIEEIIPNKDNNQISGISNPIKYSLIKFKNGYSLYGYNPIGNNKYIILTKINENGEEDFTVIYDANENKIIREESNGEIHTIPLKLNEYILNKLEKIVLTNDIFVKSLKSIPYIQIHIAGIKLPLIKFMILYHGLIGSLEKFSIDYKIDDKIDNDAFYSVEFKDKIVNIYPTSLRQRYIVNGLKISKISFNHFTINEFENDEEARRKVFVNSYGAYSVKNFDLIRQNIVDPITMQLLKYEGKPTDFDDILVELVDSLFNTEVSSPIDLKNVRLRLSEIMHNILYKQIAMAKNDYEIRASVDKNAKIYIDPDYVIKQLLSGESTLQYVEPVNPIDELNTSTRVTPTGIGGIPKASIQLIHRLIPFYKDSDGKYTSTYFGNISALDTNEYEKVGVNQQLTLQSLVSDKFGLFGIRKDISKLGFGTLGVSESLAPWVNNIDHDRIIKMAQQMRQTMPLIEPDPPLVQSGIESIIPQISSKRFTIKAEDDGVIEEIVPDKYIIVKYNNGKKKFYDIQPRLARLKRGKYIPLLIKTQFKKGDKVKKDQIIAGTTQTHTGIYSYGKNLVVAIMPYNGGSFEDGWVVSEDTLEKFKHHEYKEVDVIVPDTAVINNIIGDIGTEVKRGDTLINFSFGSEELADEYVEQFEDNLDEELIRLGNKNIELKSPVDGVIKDIRIYINGKVDPKIESIWNKVSKEISKFINKASKINGKEDISYLDNIDTTIFKRGSHKHRSFLFKGARILFLIETERTPSYGDKFVFRGGNKGTVTYVIPKDKKPVTKSTKLEIDWIHNPLSVIGRKNANVLLELGVGKVIYFLNKKVKEMSENPKVKTKEIRQLVLDVYNALDQTSEKKLYSSIKQKLDAITDRELRDLCKKIDPLNKPLFVFLALPFSQMKIKWVRDALDILGIPLEEYVYLPEFNTTTKNPVAVGIAYVSMLEYEPDVMLGFRSVSKYSSLTGQPVKGKSNIGIGGARIDELTLAGITDYLGKNSKLIDELYTVQSDDHTAKEDVLYQILQTGKPPENYKHGETKTKKLLRMLMYGKGLDPGF